MSHTILLVQPGTRPETRTYSDYESVNECMEGVCKIYEEHLKRRNPNTPTITYDISQLFDFLDQVKKKIFQHFILLTYLIDLKPKNITCRVVVAFIFFMLSFPFMHARFR